MSDLMDAAISAMADAILTGSECCAHAAMILCAADQDRARAVHELAQAAQHWPAKGSTELSRSYTTQLREAIEQANAGNDPELQEAIKASLGAQRCACLR